VQHGGWRGALAGPGQRHAGADRLVRDPRPAARERARRHRRPALALNPIEVDLSRGPLQNESLVARPGSILRLVGPYSTAGAARLRVLDESRRCVWRGDSLELEVHELRLLPGHYSVEVQRAGHPAARQELELGASADATILLR